jgi:Cystatin domain
MNKLLIVGIGLLQILQAGCTTSSVSKADILGGYEPMRITKEVTDAATFATREQARVERVTIQLVKVDKAERQIVAGTNYHVLLQVLRRSTPQHALAVVYVDLSLKPSLSSWQWLP